MPFCVRLCPYCSFYKLKFDKENQSDAYVKALLKEIAFFKALCQGYQVESVYLGGGTPSLLSAQQMEDLVTSLRSSFEYVQDAQWCLEINPSYITAPKLATWKQLGFNRISMGVQSLSGPLLSFLGRDHSEADVHKCLRLCENYNFDSISIDMMLALPNQNKQDLIKMLALLDSYPIQHISVYSLTIEPGTPFLRKNIQAKEEDAFIEDFQFCETYLSNKGFNRYEVSNFSMPGHESRHNIFYWMRKSYIGMGPGAHSYFNNKRFKHSRNLAAYLENPIPKMPKSSLSRSECLKDYLLARTRYLEPISFSEIESRFKVDLHTIAAHLFKRWQDLSWLRYNDQHFSFESAGLLRLDALILELWEAITCSKS